MKKVHVTCEKKNSTSIDLAKIGELHVLKFQDGKSRFETTKRSSKSYWNGGINHRSFNCDLIQRSSNYSRACTRKTTKLGFTFTAFELAIGRLSPFNCHPLHLCLTHCPGTQTFSIMKNTPPSLKICLDRYKKVKKIDKEQGILGSDGMLPFSLKHCYSLAF